MVAATRQRADLGRVVDDEGRLPQIGLGHLLEKLQLQRAEASFRPNFDLQRGELFTQPGGVAELRETDAGMRLANRFADRQAGEGPGEVERATLVDVYKRQVE